MTVTVTNDRDIYHVKQHGQPLVKTLLGNTQHGKY